MSNKSRGDRRYPRPLPEVRRAAQQTLTSLGWSWKPMPDGGLAASWSPPVIRFAKSDISIAFHGGHGTLVRVDSTSRLGAFDFGQSARHVKDFFGELEEHLAGSERRRA